MKILLDWLQLEEHLKLVKMNGIKKLEKEWKKGTTNIFQLLSQLDRHGNLSYKVDFQASKNWVATTPIPSCYRGQSLLTKMGQDQKQGLSHSPYVYKIPYIRIKLQKKICTSSSFTLFCNLQEFGRFQSTC